MFERFRKLLSSIFSRKKKVASTASTKGRKRSVKTDVTVNNPPKNSTSVSTPKSPIKSKESVNVSLSETVKAELTEKNTLVLDEIQDSSNPIIESIDHIDSESNETTIDIIEEKVIVQENLFEDHQDVVSQSQFVFSFEEIEPEDTATTPIEVGNPSHIEMNEEIVQQEFLLKDDFIYAEQLAFGSDDTQTEISNEDTSTSSKDELVSSFQNCLKAPVRDFASPVKAVAENKIETDSVDGHKADDSLEKNLVLSALVGQFQTPVANVALAIKNVADQRTIEGYVSETNTSQDVIEGPNYFSKINTPDIEEESSICEPNPEVSNTLNYKPNPSSVIETVELDVEISAEVKYEEIEQDTNEEVFPVQDAHSFESIDIPEDSITIVTRENEQSEVVVSILSETIDNPIEMENQDEENSEDILFIEPKNAVFAENDISKEINEGSIAVQETDFYPENDLSDEDISELLDLIDDFEEADETPEYFEEDSGEPETTIIDFSSLDVEYQTVDLTELDFDSAISKLVDKIAANKLIGYDLLQLAGNDEFKERIHAKAKEYLKINYRRSASNLYVGRGEIIISLVLIALEHYDGSYWDYVYDEYEDFYDPRSKQKIDAMIRRILAYYSNGENRYINYVIRHAITPKHFIKDFISFVFDIYEDTFKCELIDGNNAMNEILSNIYIDVSSKYENANGTFGTNAKTYKLIKTTKEIIDNVEWFGELIAYTKLILRYIDSYYWNETDISLPYRDFFEPFFEEWINENRYKFIERESSSREKTQWTASYRLDQTNVVLHIPNYLLKKEYDPSTLVIEIENDGEILHRVERPRTVSVVGGYLVSGFDTKLKKPIGEVKYNIYAGKTLLYSSNSKLYRDYLFFSDSHKELRQNSKYSGNVDVVGAYIRNVENISIYYRSHDYCIGNLYLNEYESILADGKPIFVPLINEEKIFGELIPQALVKSYHNEFDVYRNIKGIVFVGEDIKENKLDLQINGRHHHLREYTKTPLGNKFVYRISLEKYLEVGFNNIRINNSDAEKTVYSKSVFLCPEYSAKFTTDEDKIKLKIDCSLVEGNEFISDMNSDDLFRLPIHSKYFDRELVLIPNINIPVYRIDKNEWRLFKTDFSIKEISVYSKIWLKGFDFESISYLASDGKTLVYMNAIEVQHQKYLPCDQIKQFEAMKFTFATLLFYKDNLVVDLTRVYYRSDLDKKSLSISYSEDTGVLIKFAYFGDDPVNVSLFKGDICAFSYDFESSPVDLSIKDVETFTTYKLVITGGENDLFSLNSEQYKMYEKDVVFYDEDGILGRTFNIDKCRFETYIKKRKEWAEGYRAFRDTRIEVKEKIDDNIYSAKLIHSNGTSEETMDVELLVTTEISGGTFWGSISSEGDLLLLHYVARTVVFKESEHTKNYNDVLEYKFSFLNE